MALRVAPAARGGAEMIVYRNHHEHPEGYPTLRNLAEPASEHHPRGSRSQAPRNALAAVSVSARHLLSVGANFPGDLRRLGEGAQGAGGGRSSRREFRNLARS